MSQSDNSTSAQGPLADVTWHGAVLTGIPVVFVVALLVGAVTSVVPNDGVAVGATAALAVTGYAMFWAPDGDTAEKQ